MIGRRTAAEMPETGIRKVVDLWAEQIAELGRPDSSGWVRVFENKGEIMGCSNPHPHRKIWALDELPNEPFKENQNQRR